MIRKLLIAPYFGEFPEWMDKFTEQLPRLKAMGYDVLIDTDLEGFKKRVKRKLGIDAEIVPGEGKVWDYRGLLGYLYQDHLQNYEFWGTVDFDVVFGNVDKFFPDELLNRYDIISNHNTYVCGFFSLYRNVPEVNTLFKRCDYEKFLKGAPNGWVETEYSRAVEKSGLKYKYMMEQGDPFHPPFNLKLEGNTLYQDGKEIAMLHFRRKKQWPL